MKYAKPKQKTSLLSAAGRTPSRHARITHDLTDRTEAALHRRWLSLLLCFALLVSSLQAYSAMAVTGSGDRTVTVTYDGSAVERLTLPENERAELTAVCTPASDSAVCQWQILADAENDIWANIYDGTDRQLTVSYALVQSLLDDSGSTYLRCRITVGGDVLTSSPVCVTVKYMPPFDGSESAGQQTASPERAQKSALRAAAQDSQDDNEAQMVSITINYLDGVSGLPIYSAYTGQVNVSADGYKATVISPTYLGYAPHYDQNDPAKTLPDDSGKDYSDLFPDLAPKIELDIPQGYAEPQYTVNIYYFAINVPYAVRYYFQNIHDDQYTENVGLYKTAAAKTGTIVSDEKLAEFVDASVTVGFTKLYHHPTAVAADGSTVFECYYDRTYHMLMFDNNGGYGTDPIYARYGTPFVVNEPTRHGYVFSGWDLRENGKYDGKKNDLPSTIPAENRLYRAMWTQANTTYHVAYWLQKADSDMYDYIGTVKMDNVLSGSKVTPADAPPLEDSLRICGDEDKGHIHTEEKCYARHTKHYLYDTEKNKDTVVTVNGDGSTVLNVYYTRKYYTLRFIYARETQDNETNSTFSVVGGSTYGFGNVSQDSANWFKSGTRDYTLEELLAHVNAFTGGEKWGSVEALPSPTDPTGAHYVTGTYPESGYTTSGERFHYLELTARYGADLTNLWPTETTFGKVKVKNPETHTLNGAAGMLDNDKWGNYAYFAGWNGEYKVQYSLDKDNTTIKGLYQKMDDTVLLGSYTPSGSTDKITYDYTGGNITRQIDTKTTVGGEGVHSNVCYFLAFFDNGANVSWSIPREWIYESFVPVFTDELTEEQIRKIKAAAENDKPNDTYTDPETKKVYYYYAANVEEAKEEDQLQGIYRLYDRVITSDDNVADTKTGTDSGQTQTVLTGFRFELEDRALNINRRFEQFENQETSDKRRSFTSRFFYTREYYSLTLHSHGGVFTSLSAAFDSLMDKAMAADGKLLEPPYPDTLEKNAYYFDGWYASPECIDGTQYTTGKNYKMPATDVVLYAKWAPKTHTVRFFRTRDDMLRYEANKDESGLVGSYGVKHGQVLGAVDTPSSAYIFNGWFYESAGRRNAYTPLDMPVVHDMNVFAVWSSLTPQPYRIHYALHDPETETVWTDLIAAAADKPKDNAAYTVTNGAETRTYIYLASDAKFHLQIADDSEGFAYQGSTRTFVPKVGDPYSQLYEKYNKGHYPTLASHSITMGQETNPQNLQNNVFTFTYVKKEIVSYRVEYRYADTGELIDTAPGGGKVTKSTGDAVITERFAVIENYIPDAFFKRLILAVEKKENGEYDSADSNVIVFYYSKNTANAYYAVHYMLQNADAKSDALTQTNGKFVNYTESSAHTEGIGNVGQICSIPPQTFSGFTVKKAAWAEGDDKIGSGEVAMNEADPSNPCFDITVSKDGTELYIFYTRNAQEYKIYFLEYNTTDISDLKSLKYTDGTNGVLLPILTKSAKFGATVRESAETVSIGGMTCISALTQSILIRSDNDQNYIIFYYTPVQRTIEYKVWAHGGGTLDTTLEVFNGDTAAIKGSTASALEGYTFAGWYLDEACTVPADSSGKGEVTGSYLRPLSEHLDVMPRVNVFYAKFLPNNGSLTIIRKNGEYADDNSKEQSSGKQVFVYKIQAKNDPNYVIYVTITGNGSVTVKDLPCRSYTVEQQNEWSWRYTDPAQTVSVKKDGSSATFDDPAAVQSWLNGNSERIQNRKG